MQGLPELTQALLDKAVDLNAADKEERTPVMHAIQCGTPGLALQLIERGVEVDLKDKDGKTALLYATEKLNEEVCVPPHPALSPLVRCHPPPGASYVKLLDFH